MAKRGDHPQRILTNYDPHRDTQWTQNSAAILRFIGGGVVEYKTAKGEWRKLRTEDFSGDNHWMDALGIFASHECRIAADRK